MNDLITIERREVAGATVQTCNARDLWQFVESKQDFSTWIKGRIERYGLVEDEDFTVHKFVDRRATVIDYHLTIDTAKEMAMVENNDKGREIRRYFIACERKAKEAPAVDPIVALNDPAIMRGLLLTYSEKVLTLETKVGELAPKAEALDRISAGAETLTMTQASKVLGKKRETMTARMHAEHWVYRQNGSWVAYDQHLRNGNLVYKEATYTDEKTGLACRKPYCHVTPKGLVKLAQMFAVELEGEPA